LQLFESWSEGLSPALFQRLIVGPTRALIARLRALGADVPVIGFPRGAGAQLAAYVQEAGVSALGVDTQTPAAFAFRRAPEGMALQGNLDPMTLVVGGEALDKAARDVLFAFKQAPHIFNLGHGITPDATPENVDRLVKIVKGGG
jgi:uroporphyrinogen decarboxylase